MRVRVLMLASSMAMAASAVATGAAPGLAGAVDGVVRAGGRPVANAVVWLEGGVAAPPADRRQPVMDQKNLQFVPQVLVVRVGTLVKFPNDDRVFHNVFSFHDGKKFDLGIYPVGAVKQVRFDHPGVSRLFCNIHPGMAAYIVAVDSDYFATSDSRGVFRLDAPAGQYTYKAWRPGAGTLSGRITVDDAAHLTIDWP